jgi:hypothetical protein
MGESGTSGLVQGGTMRRFSIRTLMAFVVASAIGLAAVTSANDLWAAMMTLIVLAAVIVAVLGALFSRSKRRAWWIGFASFGGGYLMMSNGPGGSQLTTTRALQYAISQASPTPVIVAEVPAQHFRTPGGDLDKAAMESFARHIGSGSPSYAPTNDSILVIRQPDYWWRTLLPGTANRDEFIRVSHAFFALWAGLVGGVASFVLARLVAIGRTVGEPAIGGIVAWRSKSRRRVRRAERPWSM